MYHSIGHVWPCIVGSVFFFFLNNENVECALHLRQGIIGNSANKFFFGNKAYRACDAIFSQRLSVDLGASHTMHALGGSAVVARLLGGWMKMLT